MVLPKMRLLLLLGFSLLLQNNLIEIHFDNYEI